VNILYEFFKIRNFILSIFSPFTSYLIIFGCLALFYYVFYIYMKISKHEFTFRLLKPIMMVISIVIIIISISKFIDHKQQIWEMQFNPIIQLNISIVKNNKKVMFDKPYIHKKILIAENSSSNFPPNYNTGFNFSSANYKLPNDLAVQNYEDAQNIETIIYLTKHEAVANYTGGLTNVSIGYDVDICDIEKKELIEHTNTLVLFMKNREPPMTLRASRVSDDIDELIPYFVKLALSQ
jgi:hypothetical protein